MDCPVTNCILKTKGCIDLLNTNGDIIVRSDINFAIIASELNPLGYVYDFCFEC